MSNFSNNRSLIHPCMTLNEELIMSKHIRYIDCGQVDLSRRKYDKYGLYGLLHGNAAQFVDSIVICRYFYLEGNNKEEFSKYFDVISKYMSLFHKIKIVGGGHKRNIFHKFMIKSEEFDATLCNSNSLNFYHNFIKKANSDILNRATSEIGCSLNDVIRLICNKKSKWSSIDNFYDYMFGNWWKEV